MVSFKEYSTVLDIECSVDYWSDEAIDEAVQYLDNFDISDWDNLNQSLSNKSVEWQTRCAETMSEIAPERGMPVLISLLSSPVVDVLEAVVDSLNSFSQSGETIEFSESEEAILYGLVDRGGLIGQIASRLLQTTSRHEVHQ